jgi:hypothetical protein
MADDDKIRLPEMVLWVAGEISRQEAWEQVLTEEGKRLHPEKARALAVSRKTLETLELLQEFEAPFVDMVRLKRTRQRAEMKQAPAPKASTATRSPQDDPTAAG